MPWFIANSVAKETLTFVSSSPMITPNDKPKLSATAYPVITLLFLATGASGLIYQVVWQRYFLNTFGATIYSVSAVLSSFMGGLALGSLVFGRLADKMKRPLAAYGVIEIAVALTALLVPFLLGLMEPVFTSAYREFGSQFFAYSLLRFAFVFLILLIPTTLMGATLPILSRFITRNESTRAGGRVGLLYAVNTTGAVLGAFLCGFYFIRWWGVTNTVWFAAALNLLAGIVSLLLSVVYESNATTYSSQETGDAVNSVEESPRSGLGKLILLAYGISGFAALSLEVVWSRSLVFTFENLKNTTYSFTMMLTTFLIGIALGSAVMTPFVNRLRHPVRSFAILQVVVGLLSATSFFALYYLAYNFGNDWLRELDDRPGNIRWNAAVLLVFLKSALVVGPATFCMGLAFPVAVRAVVTTQGGVASTVGRLYAINTLGAILGSAATGFFLLPWLGIANTIAVMGAMQMIMGVWIMFREPSVDRHRRITWAVLAGAAMAIILIRTPRPAVFEDINAIEKLVFYEEGPLATVSVVENSLQYRTIFVDNVGVAGTDPMLLTDQKSLAHVPMLLLEDPKSALTVGFGSGGASYSYTLYPQLERIDCVEITPTVPQAAPFLQDSNKGVIYKMDESLASEQKLIGGIPFEQALQNPKMVNPVNDSRLGENWFKSDPRYNIVLDDARSYLRFTDHQYDIIATDCTDLRYKSNANLYDLEYFTLCRDRITSDGMVVVWMPLAGLSDAAMKVALRTFYKVFPNMEVFFMNNQPTHYVLLLGTKSPLKVDVNRLQQRLAVPGVADDLAEIYLNSGEKILSCFVTGREKMGEYLADSPVQELNTEDYPYLEFESPRYGYSDSPLLDNLDELYKYGSDPMALLADPESHPEFVQSLEKYLQATPHIIKGHRLYRQVDVLGACAAYLEAQKINPDDTSVKDLLNFEEVRRKIQGQGNTTWARWIFGKTLAMQGRNPEAVMVLNEMLTATAHITPSQDPAITDFRKDALLTLAEIYTKENQPEKAAQYRKQAGEI